MPDLLICFLVINLISFLYFGLYCRFWASKENSIHETIIIILSLLWGSLGVVLGVIIFNKYFSAVKKATMMSLIFAICSFVIQIIFMIFLKDFKGQNINWNIMTFLFKHQYLMFYLLIINIFTFILFAIDKNKAIHNHRRIAITTLFFFSFIGGSIGAYLAMYIFRHKTTKNYFKHGLPLVFLMQIALLLLFTNLFA